MTHFFTSDTHFGHGNIIKYCDRPFMTDFDKAGLLTSSKWRMTREAVRMMDTTLINNINSFVGENDTLWHLGDWAFAPKDQYYETCRYYRDQIKCRNVNLLWGNHDRREIQDLFSNTYDHHEVFVNGQMIVLCHYAHAIFNKSHRGSWHLYGHSHGNAEDWMDKHMPSRKSMDVGVDNAAFLFGQYRPFSFYEIKSIMDGRKGFSLDHHDAG